MAVTDKKNQHNLIGKNRIKMRVVEIYYGFTDYIHGVTTGKTQHHSLSGRNAYAICKTQKTPFIQTSPTLNDAIWRETSNTCYIKILCFWFHPLMWQLSLAPFLTIDTSMTFLLPATSFPALFLLICTLYPSERSCNNVLMIIDWKKLKACNANNQNIYLAHAILYKLSHKCAL